MRWLGWFVLATALCLVAPSVAAQSASPDAAAAAAARRDEAQRLARLGVRHPFESAEGRNEAERPVSPSLASLALNAVAIVRATDLSLAGTRLSCRVTAAIFGRTPGEIVVENKAIEPKLVKAHDEHEWILFLSNAPEGLAAIGAASGCGVPYTTDGHAAEDFSDYVLDSVTLAELVQKLAGTRGASDAATASVVAGLLEGTTASERLAGLQLARERELPPGEAEAAQHSGLPWPSLPARVGATHALELLLTDPPRTAANAVPLLAWAPPATIFRRLGPVARREDDPAGKQALAERSAALHAALGLVEAEFLERHAADPAIVKFLGERASISGSTHPMLFTQRFWTLLLADDRALIAALLRSGELADRQAARRWLLALAGEDFGLGTAPDAAAGEATVAKLAAFCETLKAP